MAAGMYQFTPLKRMCLANCRNPLNFLVSHWRPGFAGAVRIGFAPVIVGMALTNRARRRGRTAPEPGEESAELKIAGFEFDEEGDPLDQYVTGRQVIEGGSLVIRVFTIPATSNVPPRMA
jgi:hypothetical protein